MSTDQARTLIDQVADYGCPVILFSGGEPLLRKDLFELIAYAGSRKLRTVLSTNGTRIDPAAALALKHLNISYVGISLDGPEPLHDAFRGHAGCFRDTLAGIRNCRAAGLRTGLRCTISRRNHEHIETIFDIADQNEVRRICFYHLIRTGRATELRDQTLTAEQARDALDRILDKTEQQVMADRVEEVLTVGNHADGPYLLLRLNRLGSSAMARQALDLLLKSSGNRVGQNIACIGWNGDVYPDQFWRNYPLGNVMRTPFGRIWDNANDPVLEILRDKDRFKDPKCARCRYFAICKGNFRSLSGRPDLAEWRNEPECYLSEQEITSS
jgi:radical SAM protein with 4Fe4S-binding SPASM domain